MYRAIFSEANAVNRSLLGKGEYKTKPISAEATSSWILFEGTRFKERMTRLCRSKALIFSKVDGWSAYPCITRTQSSGKFCAARASSKAYRFSQIKPK